MALTGIPERNAEGDSMADVAHDAVVDTIRQLSRGRRRDPEAVRAAVVAAVRSALAAYWGKKPVCHVHVLTL
jgi:ribonuclease J